MFDSFKHKGQRTRLVQQLQQKGVSQASLLKALEKVPRHVFVENAMADLSYEDKALPIKEGQTISQPFTVAFQTQLLGVKAGMKVLEIGTGSGYQAAVLCEMGAEVYSIEKNTLLYRESKARLQGLNYTVKQKCGDGTLGWPSAKPFMGIIVTAASPLVPEPLKKQLAIGGKLVIPVGSRDSQLMKLITRKARNEYEIQSFQRFRFVPLLGKYGFEES